MNQTIPQIMPDDSAPEQARAWAVVASIPDPELPSLTLEDLGILRGVEIQDDGALRVRITPTYSGCPAVEPIQWAVREALTAAGFAPIILQVERDPAWNPSWITQIGRAKLLATGIAPPDFLLHDPTQLFHNPVIMCPRCGARAGERLSAFGSTPCKATYRCTKCLEPFEYFKCL